MNKFKVGDKVQATQAWLNDYGFKYNFKATITKNEEAYWIVIFDEDWNRERTTYVRITIDDISPKGGSWGIHDTHLDYIEEPTVVDTEILL